MRRRRSTKKVVAPFKKRRKMKKRWRKKSQKERRTACFYRLSFINLCRKERKGIHFIYNVIILYEYNVGGDRWNSFLGNCVRSDQPFSSTTTTKVKKELTTVWLREPGLAVKRSLAVHYFAEVKGRVGKKLSQESFQVCPADWFLSMCNERGPFLLQQVKHCRPATFAMWTKVLEASPRECGHLWSVAASDARKVVLLTAGRRDMMCPWVRWYYYCILLTCFLSNCPTSMRVDSRRPWWFRWSARSSLQSPSLLLCYTLGKNHNDN